jgi:hypothetical protein
MLTATVCFLAAMGGTPLPRKKKEPRDMTSEELAKRVFPPKVLRELKKVAHQGDAKPRKSSSPPKHKR